MRSPRSPTRWGACARSSSSLPTRRTPSRPPRTLTASPSIAIARASPVISTCSSTRSGCSPNASTACGCRAAASRSPSARSAPLAAVITWRASMQPQRRTIALGALAAVFLVAGAAAAAWWWLDGRWYEATDDAYAQGNLVQLTPQIGGIVVRINADDTALVRAGDPVVVLDADVTQAAAKLGEAYLAAQRASIVAPVTGYVAKRSVQLGQQVAPGAALLAIVPLAQVWVDANFKETQLQHVRIGQPVTLTSDLYGGAVTYHGTVIGLGSGTGSAFALLPAQKVTGNCIQIVQRLPF